MKVFGVCVCPRDEYEFLIQHIDGPRLVRDKSDRTITRARRELVRRGFVAFDKRDDRTTFTTLTDSGRRWICKLLGLEADVLTGYLNDYPNPKNKITLGENHDPCS